jgi:thiamine pyrophosphate-dependent acetolactate synthase large subunit-like protein
MNIQELQTIKHYNLPVKIFIMNNNCYGIIKQFQDSYFDSRYIATETKDYTNPGNPVCLDIDFDQPGFMLYRKCDKFGKN